jgi:hypothetical protein
MLVLPVYYFLRDIWLMKKIHTNYILEEKILQYATVVNMFPQSIKRIIKKIFHKSNPPDNF